MALAFLMGAGHAQAQSKSSPTQSNSANSSLADHEARRDKFKTMCANPTPSQRETLEIWARAGGQSLGAAFCNAVMQKYFDTRRAPWVPLSAGGGSGYGDLSPFQYFSGVNSFNVSSDASDLTPIAGFSALESLYVQGNKNTIDISVIANFKSLKSLSLRDTQVVSLEPLAALSNLETLNLHMDRHKGLPGRKGLDVLRNLNNLRQLDMDVEEPLGDQLKDLHKLQGLAVYGPVSNVCSFRDLVNLESLYLQRANIENISCLKKLDKLYALVIDGSPVKDVSALASLPKLKILSLRNTLVTDLSAFTIQNNVTIGSIDATGAPLRWCSPKTAEDVKKGISCLNPDGTEKPWWKRALRW